MATLVFFHAHPDDEAIATGGTMAKAAADGHRVILVTATGGEHGEVAEGFLADGETLGERRAREAEEAARILGVHRGEFLGYVDSGMVGTPTNDHPDCFWQADIDDAAQRLAKILAEEGADVLTVYDDNGGYGHPDHIQVHRVGVRAAELAGITRVYESTINRDHIRRMMAQSREMLDDMPDTPDAPDVTEDPGFGKPESVINTTVDVSPFIDVKRKAMAAHASQIPPDSWFLSLPDEAFLAAFGQEWFIRRGAPADAHETDLLAGL